MLGCKTAYHRSEDCKERLVDFLTQVSVITWRCNADNIPNYDSIATLGSVIHVVETSSADCKNWRPKDTAQESEYQEHGDTSG